MAWAGVSDRVPSPELPPPASGPGPSDGGKVASGRCCGARARRGAGSERRRAAAWDSGSWQPPLAGPASCLSVRPILTEEAKGEALTLALNQTLQGRVSRMLEKQSQSNGRVSQTRQTQSQSGLPRHSPPQLPGEELNARCAQVPCRRRPAGRNSDPSFEWAPLAPRGSGRAPVNVRPAQPVTAGAGGREPRKPASRQAPGRPGRADLNQETPAGGSSRGPAGAHGLCARRPH